MTNNAKTVFNSAGGERYTPLAVDNNDPEVAAVLTKLVRGREPSTPATRARIAGQQLSQGSLKRLSSEIARNIFDAKALMRMLPDLELVRDIITSLIMSPKDMGPGEILFRVNKGRFTGEVTGAMLEVIRTHFKDVYKIDDLARKMLSASIFERGSYPVMVLPENAIDVLINDPRRVSLESITSSDEYREAMTDYIGLLGPASVSDAEARRVTPATEQFGTTGDFRHYDPNITITYPAAQSGTNVNLDLRLRVLDNPEVLKRSRLTARLRRDRTHSLLERRRLGPKLNIGPPVGGASMESIISSQYTGGEGGSVMRYPVLTGQNMSMNSIYRTRQQSAIQMQVIPTPSETQRNPVGHPLTMHLPSEAVIPLHVPGDPTDHVAYFVVLDENFNPVSRESSFNYFAEMGNSLMQQNSMPRQVIQAADRAMNGMVGMNAGNTEQRNTIQELELAYSSLIEADLQKRVTNGVAGGNVKIARPQEVYRLMLTRSFQQRQTNILYVPAEMMTYVAFDYNEYGVGESMLHRSMIISGMRVALQFANVQAGMKNSVSRSRLRITLDPEDPDPEMTVEEYIHNYVRTSRGMLPIGIVDPNDILSYLANAAVEIEVTGGNPLYPETSMVVEDSQSNVNKPDTDLEDSLKARHHAMFGLTPEMVDQSNGTDFATTLVQQNIMLSKRVYQWQDTFKPFLTDHVQCYTINSGPLLDALRKIVLDNRGKLTRAQLNDQAEAVKGGELEVDEDLRNMVQVISNTVVKDSTDSKMTEDQRLAVDAVVYEFIQSLQCELPRPDGALQKNQQTALEEYSTMLEKGLDAYFSSEFLTDEFIGELGNSVEPTRKALHAYFMRQYMAENNIMPELMDLTIFNASDGPALDLLKIQSGHLHGIRSSLLGFMTKINAAKMIANDKLAEINEATGSDGGGGSDYSSSSDDSGSDDGGSGDGGGDDGGFGGDDAPSFDFGGGDDEGGGDDAGGGDEGGDDAGGDDAGGDDAGSDDAGGGADDAGGDEA